jgi:hypothetical protein
MRAAYLASIVELVEHIVGPELALVRDWDQRLHEPLSAIRETSLANLLLPHMRLIVELVEGLHELVQLLAVGVGVAREVVRRPLQLVMTHDVPASHSLVTLDAILIQSPTKSEEEGRGHQEEGGREGGRGVAEGREEGEGRRGGRGTCSSGE